MEGNAVSAASVCIDSCPYFFMGMPRLRIHTASGYDLAICYNMDFHIAASSVDFPLSSAPWAVFVRIPRQQLNIREQLGQRNRTRAHGTVGFFAVYAVSINKNSAPAGSHFPALARAVTYNDRVPVI